MKFEEFINKIKNEKIIDLSSAEDLSIAVMNLISIEEHLAFSVMKTNNKKYFNILNKVRGLRVRLLKKLVKKTEGEEWCISKHILGASMRMIETGNKYLKENKEGEAYSMFKDAFELYSLFWVLNLNLKTKNYKQIDDSVDTSFVENKKWKISDLFKKILNCCKE